MRTPLLLLTFCAITTFAQQANDAAYTAKIREYTTEPFFLTELVDHLPASATVPTPEKILGYAVGTPNKLTYTKDLYRYFRALEKASPRVKVFSIGQSEGGRETLLVAVSDEANIAKLDRYREITARLADPRITTPAESKTLIAEGLPIYWASGSIHSPETASPEMLMELAYRLAVEDSPMIQGIRKNMVVLLTPTSEVDGRDREVDVYNYRKANPDKGAPNLLYWGKYVAHDNNRDGMSMSLALSRIMMKTFLDWHPTVLHDLHESVPFLYTSTGMGPYNAWLDPIVVDEWQSLAYHEIEEMTKRGVPGVWTHGFYDGWAPNYMFYAANGHNSIGRFYETFGGQGADTSMRTVPAAQTTRTWFRPNPPLARVKWSIRNNINLQQSAILFAMDEVSRDKNRFLGNFYLKSQRSIAKAKTEGPAAWVLPADEARPAEAAELMNLLSLQGVEISKMTAPFGKFGTGSYVIRMDQPYSRMADMLLDTQYYNITDPKPYDDTGWSFGPLKNVKTVRVTDQAVLTAPMDLVKGLVTVPGAVSGLGPVYLINHNTDNTLATLRFKLANAKVSVAEEPFEAEGHKFSAGSFAITGIRHDAIAKLAQELGLTVTAAAEAPPVPMHEMRVPRIALVHTWQNTQNEGWYRVAFDKLQIPFTYISDHTVRDTPKLRDKFDVVLFGPINGTSQRIVNGLPMNGAPIPFKGSALTPNLANSPDTTDDMRGGMGLVGLMHIKEFVEQGGLFITIGGNASIPVDYGLIDGVQIIAPRELKAQGAVYNTVFSDKKSPIAYGYGDKLAVYFNLSPILNVSANAGFGAGAGGGQFGDAPVGRPTGRGTPTDPDIVQGRAYTAPEARPEVRPGEEAPIPEEMREMMRTMMPPPNMRPRIVARFAPENDLFVSGMLAGAKELAGHPSVVDVPLGRGHVVMFANNPMWRASTQGSYFLIFNAMLNFDHLDAGRPAAPKTNPRTEE